MRPRATTTTKAGAGTALRVVLASALGACNAEPRADAVEAGDGEAPAAEQEDAGRRESTPADFAPRGPYGPAKVLRNQGVGTVTTGSLARLPMGNEDDPTAFTLVYPEGGAPGQRFPLLTWGNGTGSSPMFYEALIEFVVSYGFVIVAANSGTVGSGAEMLQALDWALALDEQVDSPIAGRIDREQLGALGHSQGGAGTMVVGADTRIKAIAPLSYAPIDEADLTAAGIRCPSFYATAELRDFRADMIRTASGRSDAPTVIGVTNGGDHLEFADESDDPGLGGIAVPNDARRPRAAIAAWFVWQLQQRESLRALFVGPDCGFCRDANWSLFESARF